VVNKLRLLRGPGESQSNVIVRLVGDAKALTPPAAAFRLVRCPVP
jgi:hypothetical protein